MLFKLSLQLTNGIVLGILPNAARGFACLLPISHMKLL